jgi:hypothetical protein
MMYQSNVTVILPQIFFFYSLFPGFIAPRVFIHLGLPRSYKLIFKENAFVAPRQTPSLEGQGFFCQGDHSLAENAQV